MNAKSNAQRQREWRQRQKQAAADGTEVRGIFAHPEDHPAVKQAAAKIARKRAKEKL